MRTKNFILVLIITLLLLLFFQKNNFLNSNTTIKCYKLVYDSITYKVKGFNVNLYTTLEFKNESISRKEYNAFLIVIKKDTFPLVPETNRLKIKNCDNTISIDYKSYINFKSKKFDNDSLSKLIENITKIIDNEGKTIIQKKNCKVISLMVLHNRIRTNIKPYYKDM